MGALRPVVSANIRRLRATAGLSQEAVARAAGVTLNYYGQTERGQTNITLDVLEAIAEALGVAPERLLDPTTLV